MNHNSIVRILRTEHGGAHTFNYTEDGILSIGIDPELFPDGEMPGQVQAAAQLPGCVKLNKAERQVLRMMLERIETT